MIGNNFLLWENNEFVIKTPFNPHILYEEGLHLIVTTQADYETAWENPEISGQVFELAARASKIIEETGLAPWFNIQSNGNWGLLPDANKFFHVHIYGRNKTRSWGKPIALPELPGTYKNDPMPESDRGTLIEAFKRLS
jgi:hypothetical protein